MNCQRGSSVCHRLCHPEYEMVNTGDCIWLILIHVVDYGCYITTVAIVLRIVCIFIMEASRWVFIFIFFVILIYEIYIWNHLVTVKYFCYKTDWFSLTLTNHRILRYGKFNYSKWIILYFTAILGINSLDDFCVVFSWILHGIAEKK